MLVDRNEKDYIIGGGKMTNRQNKIKKLATREEVYKYGVMKGFGEALGLCIGFLRGKGKMSMETITKSQFNEKMEPYDIPWGIYDFIKEEGIVLIDEEKLSQFLKNLEQEMTKYVLERRSTKRGKTE